MYVHSNATSSHFCQKMWNINDAEVVDKRNISRLRATFGHQNCSPQAGSNEWLGSLRTLPPRQSTSRTYDPSAKNYKKYPSRAPSKTPWQPPRRLTTNKLLPGCNYKQTWALKKNFSSFSTWSPRNGQGHQVTLRHTLRAKHIHILHIKAVPHVLSGGDFTLFLVD